MGFKQIRSDSIKKMKENRPKSNEELTKENEQLRTEIANLRDEYDAVFIELAAMVTGGEDNG